ncbi:hypothetical protein HO100_11380 [Corynebacterium ulcerans]|uniref:Major tail protein n=1 Tax=Corynebacterium ulcerans FRC58 TaxID=1408268 RepID=A0ABN4GVJ1_CORUL|nr:hypothetical protein [Corynebacterium ulcerans]AKN77521.1 Hypothetical protein CulFRC58_1667 [Corynebacterium ulcerans FRC58]NOL63362.1 hypothetical protein [Corynebacterium ulcerans]NON15688.1 hypothetical protein [Corynebacterium ulcerans]
MARNRTVGLDLRVLEDRQVLVNFSDNPIIDKKSGAFIGAWESLGVEPEGSQHSRTREVTSNTTNLTGGQTATSYAAGAITAAVDGIEGSPVMRHIENPGAVIQDGTTYGEHSSRVAKAYVAFVHKFTSGLVRIWVTREKAELTINESVTSKDPQAVPVTITFKNGADEFYYEERFYIVGKDGSVARVEEKIFKDVDDLRDQIEKGTAFFPKASGDNLKAMVVKETDSSGVKLAEYEAPADEASPEVAKAQGTFALKGATGGTFTITVGDHTTTALAHNASADDVQKALVAAGEGTAEVVGEASTGFIVRKVAEKPIVDASSLTGGSWPKAVTVS